MHCEELTLGGQSLSSLIGRPESSGPPPVGTHAKTQRSSRSEPSSSYLWL